MKFNTRVVIDTVVLYSHHDWNIFFSSKLVIENCEVLNNGNCLSENNTLIVITLIPLSHSLICLKELSYRIRIN